jgi:hypothetical protein
MVWRWRYVAYLEGDEKKFGAYNMEHGLVAIDGSAPPSRVSRRGA